jgi:hypothetical protein
MMVDFHGKMGEALRQNLIKPELPYQAPGAGNLCIEVNYQDIGHDGEAFE